MSQYLDGSEPSAAIHCTQCQASVAAHLTENGDEYVGRCDHCGTNNVIAVRAPANRVGGESIVAKREPVSNVTEKVGPIEGTLPPPNPNEPHPDGRHEGAPGLIYDSYDAHKAAYEGGLQKYPPDPADYPNTYTGGSDEEDPE